MKPTPPPQILFNLLQQNLKKREHYLQKNKIEAYRLLNLEESSLPVAIDIYKKNVVIQLFQKIDETILQQLQEALKKLLDIDQVFLKNRTKENLNFSPEIKKHFPNEERKEIFPEHVQEYGHTFFLNLSDYLDTGLFLDHRETRKWIEQQSKNKILLNTFAYTGSFTIYAAAGGAQKTYSVDLSKTYCDWIKQNLQLNHFSPEKNWVYKMDTFEFFKYAKKKNLRFDIIIIDPPTFSKNKGQHFSVQKDHPKLLNQALELVNPTGFILFSNNCKTFHFDHKKLIPCVITEKKDSIPPDFPAMKPHHCFIIAPKKG